MVEAEPLQTRGCHPAAWGEVVATSSRRNAMHTAMVALSPGVPHAFSGGRHLSWGLQVGCHQVVLHVGWEPLEAKGLENDARRFTGSEEGHHGIQELRRAKAGLGTCSFQKNATFLHFFPLFIKELNVFCFLSLSL